jgi:hypothetical protein
MYKGAQINFGDLTPYFTYACYGGGGVGQQNVLRVVADKTTVAEFTDPFFAKTRPTRSFSMTENERFGHVFAKTGSVNSGTAVVSEVGGGGGGGGYKNKNHQLAAVQAWITL